MSNINPGRIRNALQKIQEAEAELTAALAEAQLPPPNPPHGPVIVKRSGGANRPA